MKLEEIEKLPRRQRWNAIHEAALASLAACSPAQIAARLAAFEGHPARGAFANLVWEASFERRRA
jgi:hypothetical protein